MSTTSTIEAWQRDAGIIQPAECKHCHRSDVETHEYDGLKGLFCEDCADIHINQEEDRTSACCGAGRFEYIPEMCAMCHEMADFECVECES